MTYVGSDWVEIERWSDATGYGNQAEWRLQARSVQDIAANTSTVYFRLQKSVSVNTAWSYDSKSFSIAGKGAEDDTHTATQTWTYGTVSDTSWNDVGGDTSDMYWSNVRHRDNGVLSLTANATGGRVMGGTFDTDISIELPTIPRASIPSINTYPTSTPAFTLGDTITIHMNRKSSSFTHTVLFKYGNQSVTVGTAKGVTNNVSFDTSTVMANILALIPNASYYQGTIQVTTWNGNTQIGSTKSIPYTANVPSLYAPTVSGYTISETGATGKGIAGSEVVRFLSVKSISVTVTPKSGATISKAVCTNGNKSVDMTLSSNKYVCTMEAPPTGTFTITATDSRGLQTTITQTGTFREYEYPTIQASNLTRANATASTGTLTANGTFWNGTAGSTANAVTIQYKLNTASSYSTSAGTRSGNTWNISQSMTGLTYTDSFSCEIKATDSFGQTTSVTVNLPPSNPVMQLGDNTVQVNDYLLAKTDIGIGTGGAITTKLSEVASDTSDIVSELSGINDTLTFRNYNYSGSWSNSSSATRTFQITGKGIVMINCYVRNGGTDDTGQCDATITLLNTSNASQGTLASSGNRVSSSSTHQISANASTQYYYDGSSTNRRLRCAMSCTKNGTNSWRIQISTIGCTIAAV